MPICLCGRERAQVGGGEEIEKKSSLKLNQYHKMEGISKLLFYASQPPKASKTLFSENSKLFAL